MVKEVLLGDNPFIGVSHLSCRRAREVAKELTLEKKIEVIESAVDAGATGFTFSTHPSNLELLKHIRNTRPDLLKKLNYYVLVPYAAKYVRDATIVGVPGLIKRITLTSIHPNTLTSIIPPKPNNFARLFIEAELREYMKILPRGSTKAILLHEVLTELITAFNLPKIVEILNEHFKKRGVGFGLETRNVVHVKRLIEESKLGLDYLMTPLNPLGYQMTPNRELAEKAIISLSRRGVRVIGINILASGVLTPDAALTYISNLGDSIYAVAFGTSNPQRARETTKKLCSLIQ